MADERLIDKDPDEDEDLESSEPFYKSSTFIFVLKLSIGLGVISSLLTGLIITNTRLSTLEEKIVMFTEQVSVFQIQHDTVTANVKLLTSSHERLALSVGTLDISTAKGELSQALSILHTQSNVLNKQLSVTRNGIMSLSRMIKGSRVWQEDYRAQYQGLFDDNKEVTASIEKLRGIQKKSKEPEPTFLEMDF
jgi:chromosome segregation ATPase